MATFRNQRELIDFGRTELQQLKLYQTLKDIGSDYVKNLKLDIQNKDKIATGDLYNSINYEILPERGDKLILLLYAASHLEYVQNGRRPGAKPPPYRKLIPWINVRGIKFQGKSTNTTAIIIARSIGKKGIKPVPQIKQTLTEINNRIRSEEIAKAAKLDVEKVIGQFFAGGFLQ